MACCVCGFHPCDCGDGRGGCNGEIGLGRVFARAGVFWGWVGGWGCGVVRALGEVGAD